MCILRYIMTLLSNKDMKVIAYFYHNLYQENLACFDIMTLQGVNKIVTENNRKYDRLGGSKFKRRTNIR